MKKKRYLFIDGQLNGGGAERVLLDILRNFDYVNNEVTLLQVVGGGLLASQIPANVQVVHAWDDYSLSYKLIMRFSLKLGWNKPWRNRLKKALKNQERYDVAISFLEGMPLKAHSLITALALRNYSWVHVDLNSFRYEKSMFKSEQDELDCYNKMDAVICVARNTCKAFLQRFKHCTTPVKMIYNPIDINSIREKAYYFNKIAKKKSFTVIVCGRLTAPKKIDRVLRLACQMRNNNINVKFQLLGDGELRSMLMRMCDELDISHLIEFVGFQNNPYPYIKNADLLLSTSITEGFSLVICEAMALGTPVVATKTAGPMEIIDKNQCGLLCDHDDASIFEAVKLMINDAELRKKCIDAGLKRINDFSVQNAMKKIYDL